ncbi:hypothetical protein BGLA2_1860027 [Burkholderia gladioli]|nr:hypothetical protein BGLA2_1860027 [Burkholderia gladioli]
MPARGARPRRQLHGTGTRRRQHGTRHPDAAAQGQRMSFFPPHELYVYLSASILTLPLFPESFR